MMITMTRLMRTLYTLAVATAITLMALPANAQSKAVRIVQTNAAGDNIHLIDPATNEIVDEITGVEVVCAAATRKG